jgi:hypothetical protein
MSSGRPAITCLCPTYRRPGCLPDAVRCFLRQDYPERHLLILNDAPEPIDAGALDLPEGMGRVVNAAQRYPTLGHKRQALLEMAATPLVAHWDDDDLVLPWHLSMCVAAWRENPGASCARPNLAWFGVGPSGAWRLRGPCRNVWEGLMVFERERALALGGYALLDSGQAKALLVAFARAGELHTWDPPLWEISYIYRWADGHRHVSTG